MAPSGLPVEACSCGRHYPAGGAALCERNLHGEKELPIAAEYRHRGFLELTAEAFCAECSSPLAASVKLEGDRIVLCILPHVCPVPAPDEEVSA